MFTHTHTKLPPIFEKFFFLHYYFKAKLSMNFETKTKALDHKNMLSKAICIVVFSLMFKESNGKIHLVKEITACIRFKLV